MGDVTHLQGKGTLSQFCRLKDAVYGDWYWILGIPARCDAMDEGWGGYMRWVSLIHGACELYMDAWLCCYVSAVLRSDRISVSILCV